MYILWIRHGFSCENYMRLETFDKKYEIRDNIDPPLTDIGYKHSKKIAPHIFNKVKKLKLDIVPIFFASTLSRTMETSDAIRRSLHSKYKNTPTMIIPSIKEFSISNPGESGDVPTNFYDLVDELSFDLHVLVDYPKLNPYTPDGFVKNEYDYTMFYKVILPEIVKMLKKHYSNDSKKSRRFSKNTTIVVFSHHNVIMKNTGISLGNTGAVLQYIRNKDLKPLKSEMIFKGFEYESFPFDKKHLNTCI